MDAVQDVGEIGLRIEAVELGGFDDGHSTGQGFRAGNTDIIIKRWATWRF